MVNNMEMHQFMWPISTKCNNCEAAFHSVKQFYNANLIGQILNHGNFQHYDNNAKLPIDFFSIEYTWMQKNIKKHIDLNNK